MFFFQNYTLLNIAGAVIVVAGLLLCNEITRRNQYAAVAVFVVVPVLLSIFWWPYAKTESSADWFGWVKTYSALAGVIGFMAIRYFKKVGESKFAFIFPGFILAFNILEAIFKDFQVFQNAPNAQTLSGPWNILNAIAGVFLILTITGWMGIKVSNTKTKDMIWADQLWFWVIAYDLWNMAYCYNCLNVRSFYAGFLLLVASTTATFVCKRGAWLQHRAYTLALWGMISLTFSYAQSPMFNITTTNNPMALLTLSIASLLGNVLVFVYMIYRVIKVKRNPYTKDLYTDLKAYQTIADENALQMSV